MIEILDTLQFGTERVASIAIDNGGPRYFWEVGGLPIEGDLQPVLDARFDELWAGASAAAEPVPAVISLRGEAKQFLRDNPQARLLIELDGPDLEAAIENRTSAQETLLLKTLAFAVRFLYESLN